MIDRPVFGIDAAFTAGKKSDFFAAVGGHWDTEGKIRIFEVHRHRRGLVEAIRNLSLLRERFPGCQFASYVSGQEVGIFHHIAETTGIAVHLIPARWNKAVRAQKAVRSWVSGDILVRSAQPWTGAYLAELHAFDGREDGVDDQVDATVSLHDFMMMNRPQRGDFWTAGRRVA